MKHLIPVLNLASLIAVLVCVASPANAWSFYNSSSGRWLNRDPVAETGGKNLYCLVSNKMPGGADKLGLRPIHLEFNAFIPGPPDWLAEPGQPGSTHYYFATDRRSFLRQPEQTARLRTEATIESTLIGLSVPGPIHLRHTEASDSMRYDSDTGSTQVRRAEASGGATIQRSPGCCQLKITMSGSGKYPFTPPEFTPSIDYYVTWTLRAVGLNRVKITVEGKHDNFPAYEAVADWTTSVYSFTSLDSGPNPINLNTPVPFTAEKEITAENDCAVFKWSF